MKTRKARPAHDPWIARQFAAVQFRCLVREVIAGHSGPQALEDMLGSFAPAHVRGDFVQMIFTPAGRFRVEVRLVRV